MQPTFSSIYAIPYLIFFSCLLIFFLLENRLRRRDRSIISVQYLCCITFVVFFGFRGYTDTDFTVYYPLYESTPYLDDGKAVLQFFYMSEDNFAFKIEPGFKLLTLILKNISSEYFLLQIVSSIIDVLFLNYFFRKYSPQYVLGFIMFCIFNGLIIEINLLRNSKSIFLFLYSIQFIEKRKPLQYFVCNTIGLLLHSSAIFYFPLYFFLHKKIPMNIIYGFFILGNVIYLAQIKFIAPVVLAIGNILGGSYSLIAEVYSSTSIYNTSYGITMGFIEKFFTFIIIFISYEKIGFTIGNDRLKNIFFNSFFIFICSYLFLSEYSILTDRLTTLFVFSCWIMYPLLYDTLDKTFKVVFTVVLVIFGYYKMYFSNNFIIRQYENILWSKPSIARAYYILGKHLDKIVGPAKK